MENGSRALEWMMRILLWLLVAGMAWLFLRAMRFFLSMLLIPVASMLADVAPGLARRIDAWAARALEREPTAGQVTPVGTERTTDVAATIELANDVPASTLDGLERSEER